MAEVTSAFKPYVVDIEGLSASLASNWRGLPDIRWWGEGSVTLKGWIKVAVQYSTKEGESISYNEYVIESGATRTFSNISGQNMVIELMETEAPPPPPYTCPYCGETFGSQSELDDHIASVHPPPPPPPPGKFTWNGCKMIYGGGIDPDIDRILEAGFNTCGPMMGFTGPWLDECQRKGLWVVGGLHGFFPNHNIDGAVAFVNQWKHHPAIGAWFFLDEPTMHASYSKELQQSWYNALKAADPSRDFLINHTTNPKYPFDAWNPNAFDFCSVDIYPYNSTFISGWKTWKAGMSAHLKTFRKIAGDIPTMALVQAFYEKNISPEGPALNPTGVVGDMLAKFQEYNIGVQSTGYAMYIWTDGSPGVSLGISEDAGLFAHVKAVNASFDWPHPPPPPPETFTTEDVTCSTCESNLRITRSSITENNKSLNCPICENYIAEGTKVEVLSTPLIDRLREQIKALDAKLVEIEKAVATIRVQIDAIKKELGL